MAKPNPIGAIASETGFPKDAIVFVLYCLPKSNKKRVNQHIDAHELCWRLFDNAKLLYGKRAESKLASWGIFETADFGKIVFWLVKKFSCFDVRG